MSVLAAAVAKLDARAQGQEPVAPAAPLQSASDDHEWRQATRNIVLATKARLLQGHGSQEARSAPSFEPSRNGGGGVNDGRSDGSSGNGGGRDCDEARPPLPSLSLPHREPLVAAPSREDALSALSALSASTGAHASVLAAAMARLDARGVDAVPPNELQEENKEALEDEWEGSDNGVGVGTVGGRDFSEIASLEAEAEGLRRLLEEVVESPPHPPERRTPMHTYRPTAPPPPQPAPSDLFCGGAVVYIAWALVCVTGCGAGRRRAELWRRRGRSNRFQCKLRAPGWR